MSLKNPSTNAKEKLSFRRLLPSLGLRYRIPLHCLHMVMINPPPVFPSGTKKISLTTCCTMSFTHFRRLTRQVDIPFMRNYPHIVCLPLHNMTEETQ
jgi:hypothetical protein